MHSFFVPRISFFVVFLAVGAQGKVISRRIVFKLNIENALKKNNSVLNALFTVGVNSGRKIFLYRMKVSHK